MRLLLDACVLYPTVMREMLMGCADAGLFQPRWSDRILEEWARATLKLGPQAEVFARSEIAMLRARHPAAEVRYPAEMLRQMWLPDPDDIHVLAAAVAGHCDGIVTVNAKDFPGNLLAEEGLFRSDPDGLLLRLHDEHAETVAGIGDMVLAEANRLSPEPWTIRALMKKARLPRIGKRLMG
ncbi:PIN domain-containing protein [Loktanella sp. DSM 29012]|uniref:RSP_2648 family PIN domain-containing protein n=1 Tax=Loktanella sp. DSM 29012 TaxID=1881056 RepID=UPI0008ACF31F|nr:PIN domain-containing protein [Loktanella sp. DSM 29012]SEQ18284.1 PIN domain-containing protein [Loktanella sp. DSM 29012]